MMRRSRRGDFNSRFAMPRAYNAASRMNYMAIARAWNYIKLLKLLVRALIFRTEAFLCRFVPVQILILRKPHSHPMFSRY